jgi:hypothetical protein
MTFSSNTDYIASNGRVITECCLSSCWWCQTMSLNCGRHRAYCPSPQIIYEYVEPQWNHFVRGNWITRRKPVPVRLFLPQIPYGLSGARTRASVATDRRLTTWAMARSLRKRWNRKDLEGSPCIRLEGPRKTTNLSQDSRSLGWRLNPGPPCYEADMLAIQLLR